MPWRAKRTPPSPFVHIANAIPDYRSASRARIAAEWVLASVGMLVFWVLVVAYFCGGPQEFLRAIY